MGRRQRRPFLLALDSPNCGVHGREPQSLSRTGDPATGASQDAVILARFGEVDLDSLGEREGGVISRTALADQAIVDFALVLGSMMSSNFARTESPS